MRVTESKPNTCYLTAGGYLVTLDEQLRAPKGLCPGTTFFNQPSSKGIGTQGWAWDGDGSIGGLCGDWPEKLRIVAELPFGIPELPKGYGWKGGYPVLRKPELGEEYLSPKGFNHQASYRKGSCVCTTSTVNLSELGHRRLIVEANASPPKTEDKYVKMGGRPQVDDAKFHKDNNIETVVFATEDLEEIKMKDYTSGANPSAKGRQSRLSYFITEPLANTYNFVKPSFRYALLYSAIGLGIYAATHFEAVLSLIKSCLPKVSVEWNETNLSGAKNVKGD